MEAERAHILEALRQVNWVIGGETAPLPAWRLPRTTLIYRMRKLGIKAEKIQTIEDAVAGPARAVSHPGPFVPPSAFAAPAADAGSNCEGAMQDERRALISTQTDEIMRVRALATQADELLAIGQTAMIARLPCASVRDVFLTHSTMAEELNILFAMVPTR